MALLWAGVLWPLSLSRFARIPDMFSVKVEFAEVVLCRTFCPLFMYRNTYIVSVVQLSPREVQGPGQYVFRGRMICLTHWGM